jgi:outer membrane cobalamin receptor
LKPLIFYRFVGVLPVLLGSSLGAFSADEPGDVISIRVTGSHLPESHSPRTRLFHLDREQIEARQVTSTIALLRGVPGVDVSQSGGEGGLTFVSIRGGEPNFTAFVVDGVLMNDPTNTRGGAFDLSFIDPQSIEKIEVFAGAGSSVWGSDALAGVVNITTRRKYGESKTTAYAGAGSSDAYETGVSFYGAPAGAVSSWSLSANYRDSGSAVEGDNLERTQFTGGLTVSPFDDFSSTLNVFSSEGNAEAYPEDSGGPRLAVIRASEDRSFRRHSISLNTEFDVSPDVLWKAAASWTENKEDIENPGIAPGVLQGIPAIKSDRNYERTDVYSSIAFPGPAESYAVAGLDFVHEKGHSRDVIDFGFPFESKFTMDRSSLGAFVETMLYPAPQWTVDATARVDSPDDVDTQTTYRAGVGYEVPDWGSSISLRYSEGFKLPSFFALGSPIVGNPDLDPETSKSYELRISQPLESWGGMFTFSVYRNDYKNLVDFDPIAFTNVNRSDVRAEGTELALSLGSADTMMVNASVTYNDTRVIGEDVKLRRRPDWKGSIRSDWRFTHNLGFFGQIDYTGEYYDSSVPTGIVKMPDYVNLDVGASWTLDENIVIGCQIQNILDDDYEESVGFPNPGRNFSLRINATF